MAWLANNESFQACASSLFCWAGVRRLRNCAHLVHLGLRVRRSTLLSLNSLQHLRLERPSSFHPSEPKLHNSLQSSLGCQFKPEFLTGSLSPESQNLPAFRALPTFQVPSHRPGMCQRCEAGGIPFFLR